MKKIVILFFLSVIVLSGLAQGVIWEDMKANYPDREALFNEKASQNLLLPLTVDYSSEMPPAIDQGNQGSCVAFAIAYLKGQQDAQEIGWDFSAHSAAENLAHQFSPGFIYNLMHIHGTPPGLYVSSGMNFLVQNGDITLDKFGYNPDDDSTKPSMNIRYLALEYKAASTWSWTNNINLAREQLAAHQLVLTVIYNPSGSLHCVCLVGYNDTININGKIGAFRYLNSAGPNWGENGYGWLRYADTRSYSTYWWVGDRPNYLPEEVFRMHFNLFSKNLGEPRQKSYWHFLKGGDTVKTIKFRPALDDYLLAVDTAVDADEIVLQSYYNVSQENDKTFPIKNEFYDARSYSLPDSILVPMDWDSTLVQTVIDSTVWSQWYIEYFLFSELKVTMRIPMVSVSEVPKTDLSLSARPNPFREQTTFRVVLDKEAMTNLDILDIYGRVVNGLVNDKRLSAGEHLINFATDLPAGLYLARLSADKQIKTMKIVVTK